MMPAKEEEQCDRQPSSSSSRQQQQQQSSFSFTQLLMNGGGWMDKAAEAATTSSAPIPAVLLQSDFEVNPSNCGEQMNIISTPPPPQLDKAKRRRPGKDARQRKEEAQTKRQKSTGRSKDEKPKPDQALSESEATNFKPGKENSKPAADGAKLDYIHVRARRGQATDSHSLAERVRREKISERMKTLQDLVPGCNKVTGKAMMLDEIINYVQSLQRQVEFLSMKLAAVKPVLSLYSDTYLSAPEAPGASVHDTNCLNQLVVPPPRHQAWHPPTTAHQSPVES